MRLLGSLTLPQRDFIDAPSSGCHHQVSFLARYFSGHIFREMGIGRAK
jgi:hypothetical protein